MNAEQRGGMALNKDFRSKTGNGSVSREGRAIATPTGGSCTHIPPSLLHLSLFISSWLFYFPSPCVESARSVPRCCSVLRLCLSRCSSFPSLPKHLIDSEGLLDFCGTTCQWINQRHQNPRWCEQEMNSIVELCARHRKDVSLTHGEFTRHSHHT